MKLPCTESNLWLIKVSIIHSEDLQALRQWTFTSLTHRYFIRDARSWIWGFLLSHNSSQLLFISFYTFSLTPQHPWFNSPAIIQSQPSILSKVLAVLGWLETGPVKFLVTLCTVFWGKQRTSPQILHYYHSYCLLTGCTILHMSLPLLEFNSSRPFVLFSIK